MADKVMASPPKKKKLPFKPTALRRSAPKPAPVADGKGSDDDGLSLFRRSKEMAPIVAADRERRMKRAAQKQRELDTKAQDNEPRSSGGEKRPHEDDDGPSFFDEPRSDDTEPRGAEAESSRAVEEPATQTIEDRASELVTPPPSKRSRHGTGSDKKHSIRIEETEAVSDASPSTRRMRSRPNPEVPVGPPRTESFTFRGAPLISLDSDSEDDVKPIVAALRRRNPSIEILDSASPQPSSPPPPAEDDEFAEYELKAEQQRAKDQAMLRATEGDSHTKETTEIFVTSELPEGSPILVKFLFDKPLRVVRDTWIAMQRNKGVDIPMDQNDDVVLTWRRQKVYNYSTLLSLGIRPQADGRLAADAHGAAGLLESRTRVHLEAWTPDLFQEMEREEDLRRKREAGELSDEEAAPEEAPEPEIKIKVILKARDLEDVKLTVRPETTVETLVTGFRTQRDVGANQEVSLWFDGERLEEHVTMDDAEIDDMDTIEVHIK
ncbi:ubiquitin-2 like Rad60 SUMO-like-domain-containing protein [Ilyonectria destructans]|nr:ubiquitin-2 like Rad60 SUMO-like-domain-containing protein [Ilyonectria destructans]